MGNKWAPDPLDRREPDSVTEALEVPTATNGPVRVLTREGRSMNHHSHTEVELYEEEISPQDMEFSTPSCSRSTSPLRDQYSSYSSPFQGPTQSFTGNEGPEVLESLASIPRSTLRRSELAELNETRQIVATIHNCHYLFSKTNFSLFRK